MTTKTTRAMGKLTSAAIFLAVALSAQTIRCHERAKDELGASKAIHNSSSTSNSTFSPNHRKQLLHTIEHNHDETHLEQHQGQRSRNGSSINSDHKSVELVPSLAAKNHQNKTNFGDQSSASLFRPSIMRKLFSLGNKHRNRPSQGNGGDGDDEQDEVITKTIMVPLSAESEDEDGFVAQTGRPTQSLSGSTMRAIAGAAMLKDDKDTHKPEASLQLTRTEMSGLINDGEGPEMYREREIHGDGVTVGEEPAYRYRAAASMAGGQPSLYRGQYPGASFGSPLLQSPSGSAYEGSADNLASLQQQQQAHQLSQAGSELGGEPLLGFNHRFGSSFQDDSGWNQASGRLMQAPNEFNDMQTARDFVGHHSSADYSSAIGLPRAASSYDAAEAIGNLGAGQVLDRHASELFGHSNGQLSQFGGAGEALLNQNHLDPSMGRLSQAGSHPSMMGGSGYMGDEFASRYGNSPMIANHQFDGIDHRAFASQGSLLRGGSSSISSPSSPVPSDGRLLPLSPVVPVAEEVAPSTQHLNGPNQRRAPMLQQEQEQQQQQNYQYEPTQARQRSASRLEVHESFDDEAGDSQQQRYSGDEESTEQSEPADMYGGGGSEGETTMASVQEMSPTSMKRPVQAQQQEEVHSLVLNLPPPATPDLSPYVELSKTGSAGYYGPTPAGARQQLAHRSAALSGDGRRAGSANGLISAHAGKYIID